MSPNTYRAAADLVLITHVGFVAFVILGLVAFTFGFMTFSIIPWGAVLDNAKVDPYTHETINTPFGWELGWWLPELTAFILVMSVVVGVAGRLGQEELAVAPGPERADQAVVGDRLHIGPLGDGQACTRVIGPYASGAQATIRTHQGPSRPGKREP